MAYFTPQREILVSDRNIMYKDKVTMHILSKKEENKHKRH